MAATCITVVYLLLLGPFRALDAPHDVVPEPVRTIVWWPAQVLHQIPFFGDVMEDYLDFWWMDPNQAETTR